MIRKRRRRMSSNIIGSIVMMVTVFSLLVSSIGYFNFTEAFKKEYDVTTYHMADTAATLVTATT